MKQILICFTLLAISCYRTQAQTIQLSGLNSTQGVIIPGLDSALEFGTVNYAGDINADGLNDVLVWTDYNLYLLYGTKDSPSEINLSTLTPAQGIVIGDSANIAFAGTGDVNGDNIDDLLTLNAQDDSVCVIFGNKNGLQDMNLTDCSNGTFGIEISGCPVNSTGCPSGSWLSGAGDINGDGIQDMLLGSYLVGTSTRSGSGVVYVIFGNKDGLSNINLTILNSTQGFSIIGPADQSYIGERVSKAGDVNGDGIDDFIIGSHYGFDAYVIYGSTSGFSNIDLSNFDPSQGFMISIQSNAIEMIVSHAGDFNGDGIDDLLIGLFGGGGGAYVLYGSATMPFTVGLNPISEIQGVLIVGPDSNDVKIFGEYVSGIGDFNQDGLDDVVITAYTDQNNAGAAYVIFGTKSLPANITVSNLTSTQGLAIIGGTNEEVGYTVSGLGDFNGDSIPDLAFGTHSELNAGYIVYGSKLNPPTPKSAKRMGCNALVASIVAFILYMF